MTGRRREHEEWRDVPGWEGTYEVSDLGRVRSVDRVAVDGRQIGGAPVPTRRASNGYLLLTLGSGTRQQTRQLHRLVMLAFKPGGARRYPQVRHRNGDKTDCRLSNLRWGTQAMNEQDKAENRNRGNRRGNRGRNEKGNREEIEGEGRQEGRGELSWTSRVSEPWTPAAPLSRADVSPAGDVLGVHGNPDSRSSPANVPEDPATCPRLSRGGDRP